MGLRETPAFHTTTYRTYFTATIKLWYLFFWYSLPFYLNCSFFSISRFLNHSFLYSCRFLFSSGDNELYLSLAFCFISSLFFIIILFTVPLKKIKENNKCVTYSLKFADSMKFMNDSLSNLVDNLSELYACKCLGKRDQNIKITYKEKKYVFIKTY